MQFWRKLVSLSLLTVVIALPLLAMATCAPESARPMRCCKKCASMSKAMQAKMHGGMNGQSSRNKSAPCCDIKSSQPTPTNEYQAVAPIVLAHPSASVVEIAEAPKNTATFISEADPAPPPPDAQAQLCTFKN
jgi:hypothetical protein